MVLQKELVVALMVPSRLVDPQHQHQQPLPNGKIPLDDQEGESEEESLPRSSKSPSGRVRAGQCSSQGEEEVKERNSKGREWTDPDLGEYGYSPFKSPRKHWSDASDSDSDSSEVLDPIPKGDESRIPEHLLKLYRESAAHLSPEETPKLAEFLSKNEDVFARSADDLGRTSLVQHTIDTGNARPVKQPPRRVPVHKKHLVTEEVDKMLRRGVIEPCDGPWSSPIVLVTKKDATTRFCIDFRRLNGLTRKDAYPLPRIEDNLDALQGSKYFSTLDLISGFWQVEVSDEDKDKTAFSVGGGGLYRFNTMPFGLCNAPGTFQRLMEQVLQGLQWEIAVLYIDDVVVYSETVDQHFERLGKVLQRLRSAGLKLKPSKCTLLAERVNFLGHIVSAKGVEVDNEKVIKIQSWPKPQTLREVRSFVGLCAYYRRFVPDFSTICKPLFLLTQKGQPFVWGEAQQQAMDRMKTLLTSAPILSYPKPKGKYILDTDASNVGIGAVLSQVQDGEERVISYASKVLNKAQRNYCVTRRELLAIVEFVKQYHHYLYGAEFLVRTDHAALYWLLRKKDPEGQMARWISLLQAYNMVVQHRPGVKHSNADALSRCMEGCRDTDQISIPVGLTHSLSEIKRKAQKEACRVMTRSKSKGNPPTAKAKPARKPKPQVKCSTKPSLVEGRTPAPLSNPSPQHKCSTKRSLVEGENKPSEPTSKPRSEGSTKQSLVEGKPSAPPKVNKSKPSKLSKGDKRPSGLQRDPDQSSETPTLAVETPDPTSPCGPNPTRPPSPEPPKAGSDPPQEVDSSRYPKRKRPIHGQTPEEVADLQRQEQFVKEQLPADWSDSAIAKLQELDPGVNKVREWCKVGKAPSWSEVAKENLVVKSWWSRFDQLLLSTNGVLYLKWEAERQGDPPTYRVVTAVSMFGAVLTELHDSKTAGHLGQKKTLERLKRSRFYWPGMSNFAKQWVLNCPTCGSRKHPQYSKRTKLQTYWVGTPCDRISIDLVGPFHPRTKKGNSTILTITDQYTRWVEAFPLREATAPNIARCVVDFVCRFGMPLEIHSDRGKNIDGQVMREVCEILGVRKSHTVAFRPQSNAITERWNGVIKAMLSGYVSRKLDDWDDHLAPVMMALRTSVHRTLKVSPAAMMLGRNPRLPLDAMIGNPPEIEYQEMKASEYAQQLAEAMSIAHDEVSLHMEAQYAYQKKQYDRQVREETYTKGQAVWLREFARTKGKSPALMKNYSGPWVITQKLSHVNFRIQRTKGGRSQIVHSDRLKTYYGPVEDPWAKKLWVPLTTKQ